MKDESDTLAEARERFEWGVSHDRLNREADAEDRRFVAGEGQWDALAIEARKGRPTMTINRLPQFVKQVTGDMRQNKPEIKALPVDDATDPAMAEVYSAIIRHIESKSRAQRIYVKAGEQAVTGGIGWFRIVNEYTDDGGFDQDICVKLIRNPLSVVIDPEAVELTREDMKFAFVTELVSRKQFERDHPKISLADFDTASPSGNYGAWIEGEFIRVAEYWTREVSGSKTLALLGDGQTVDVTDMGPEELAQLDVRQTRKAPRYVVRWRRMTATAIIDEGEWPGSTIPLIPVVGEEIELGERTVRHGLVRFAKDAQRSYNYFRSAAVESVGLQPKAPILATVNQIGDNKPMWDKANVSPVPYLLYTPDPLAPGAPQRLMPPATPVAMYQEAQTADADMQATTGIYGASLGRRSNETSGVAIDRRDAQGETSTYCYTDNMLAAIERAGRIMVEVIPLVYTSERVIRIIGEDGSVEGYARVNRVLPDGRVINDLGVGRFDIEVSSGPAYATKRQQTAERMIQLMQADPRVAAVAGDLFVKALDFPMAAKIAERMQRALPEGVDPQWDEQRRQEKGGQPDPAAAAQAEAAKADLQEKQAKADKAVADAVKATADAQKALIEVGAMQGSIDALATTTALGAVADMGRRLAMSEAESPDFGAVAPQEMPQGMTAPDGNPGSFAGFDPAP